MEQSTPPAQLHIEARATARFMFDVTLGMSPRNAIELFTPEGERLWDHAWKPLYANVTDDRSIGTGTVFTTNAHEIRRIWILDAYDPEAGLVRYTVFTPEDNVTRIEVRVLAHGGGSVARVSYQRTSLNARADEAVERFASHASLMRHEWQSALDALPPR